MTHCDSSEPTRHSILVVDDIEDNRVLLERYLTSAGYLVESCNSGRAALASLRHSKPSLVLLDWMMPELSGLDTLAAMREHYDSVRLPIIMCTARDEEVSVVNALNAGANDYIVKPISLPILRARMKLHLSQRALVCDVDEEKDRAEERLKSQTRAMFDQVGREDAADLTRRHH